MIICRRPNNRASIEKAPGPSRIIPISIVTPKIITKTGIENCRRAGRQQRKRYSDPAQTYGSPGNWREKADQQ